MRGHPARVLGIVVVIATHACERPPPTPAPPAVEGCPFPYGDAIVRVEPLTIEVSQKERPRLVGATLVLRPVPTVEVGTLARSLECHLADAALQVDARVAGMATVLEIRAGDPATARDVLRRARALARPLR